MNSNSRQIAMFDIIFDNVFHDFMDRVIEQSLIVFFLQCTRILDEKINSLLLNPRFGTAW